MNWPPTTFSGIFKIAGRGSLLKSFEEVTAPLFSGDALRQKAVTEVFVHVKRVRESTEAERIRNSLNDAASVEMRSNITRTCNR